MNAQRRPTKEKISHGAKFINCNYNGHFPNEFKQTLQLLRARLRMARETADDVVRARGHVVKIERNPLWCEQHSILDGERHGLWRSVWGDGDRSEQNYVHNKQHGIYRHWYSNGVLSTAIPYVSNRCHGIVRRWRSDGCLLEGERVSVHNQFVVSGQ